MNDSAWGSVVQWTIWGIVMALVMSWLGKSRSRAQPPGEAGELRHPRSILVIGLVGFAFFFAIAVISNIYGNDTATWLTTSIFLGFALLNGLILADYRFARHRLTGDGLDYGSLTGRRGRMRWGEVIMLHYAPGMKWFTLRTADGRSARISAMMTGLPGFAAAALAQVPAAAIDAQTHAVLQATAAGNPPRLW